MVIRHLPDHIGKGQIIVTSMTDHGDSTVLDSNTSGFCHKMKFRAPLTDPLWEIFLVKMMGQTMMGSISLIISY